MKKILIFLVTCVIMLNGCSKEANDDEVMNYLNHEFKNETFEIISKEHIDDVGGSCSESEDSKNGGNIYKVQSNTTGIEFNVKDSYENNSMGWCEYSLLNNYEFVAINKYREEYNDPRIEEDINLDTQFYSIGASVKIDINNFKDFEEIANLLNDFNAFLITKKPFEKSAFEVSIYNGDKQDNINIYSYITYEDILKKIYECF